MKRQYRGKTWFGKWVYGNCATKDAGSVEDDIICNFYALESGDFQAKYWKVVSATIGRFACTIDEKDIYEGDVDEEYGVIGFSGAHLGFFCYGKEERPLYDCIPLKIIGNIHDNPELRR